MQTFDRFLALIRLR